MKTKKILLLGATFNTENMGVGTLACGAITILNKKFPDAEIFLLDYGKKSISNEILVDNRVISTSLINIRYSWKIFLPNNIIYLLVLSLIVKLLNNEIGSKIKNNNYWLKEISEADKAVAISGGDSFSDIYGLGRFFYVTLPQLLLIFLNVDFILLPQTIGPFKSSLSRVIATFIMKRADIIYSRDHEGAYETRSLLKLKENDSKIRFCYDLGFVVEPHKPRHIDLLGVSEEDLSTANRPLIGLNVSGLLLLGGYNKQNMFNLKVDYEGLIDEIIKFLIETHHVNILLVPHVFGIHEESDSHAVAVIYDRLKDIYPKRLFCLSGKYDQNEIKFIIGRCDLFIGSRMHACIAALSQSIPAIAISYSRKFIGVYESIGVEYLIADPRKLMIEETLNIINKALIERAEITKQLNKVIPEVKDTVLALFNDIEFMQ